MSVYLVLLCLCVLFLQSEGLIDSLRVRRPSRASSRQFATFYKEMSYDTLQGIHFTDLTPDLRAVVRESGIQEGTVNVLSRHTTCGITINEMEERLVDDTRQFLLKLCPPAYPYLHNDLHLRSGPPDWPGGDEAWREFRRTQPVNAHSHLVAMMLGTTESIPISKGAMQKGKYQNIMVADIDGNPPKCRSIGVQLMGTK